MPLLDDFLRHARDRPHDPAALDPTRRLDWAGLRAEVECTAAGLAALGVGPGDRVGLHLPNSVDFLVAALSTWWRGATFVPLDFSSPPARVAALVADCEPALVVTASENPVAGGLVSATPRALAESAPSGQAFCSSPSPAYIVYTSGTTGTPKGVVIGHHALDVSLRAMREIIGLAPSTRAMCVSPFHFDGSYATLFGTVHAGGTVTIPNRASLLFPRYFLHWIEDHDIDATGFTPSYLSLLIAGQVLDALRASSLRLIGIGGEPLVASEVLELLRMAPQARVFNRYGPTETTIAVTHHRLLADQLAPGEPVPVGTPHPGTTFSVLGEDHSTLPAGAPGELWIGGEQLMDGYWRDPELTQRVLRGDVVPLSRSYRSGDLVSVARDGVVTVLDRLDRVVKRRGTRISLREIADVLVSLNGVRAARAVRTATSHEVSIVGFVVGSTDPTEIRARAAEQLPETMLPDQIVVVDELPLTTSGKVDEAALLRAAGSNPSHSAADRSRTLSTSGTPTLPACKGVRSPRRPR